MTNWNKQMVTPEQINGGNEFTPDDNLSITELNAIVNNSFFSAETSKEAKEIAEELKEATGHPVSYLPQEPTEEEKQQARTNIGAMSKVSTATTNNIAMFDANGELQDSGIASGNVATKVPNATINNLASLDVNGNLLDSEISKNKVEQVEIIYDKNNSSLNWGYSNGIQGNNTITGKNFTKYKRLRIYAVLADKILLIYEISLELKVGDGYYQSSSCGLSGDLSDTVVSRCTVNLAKTTIEFQHGYFNGDVTLRNDNSAYVTVKIEGVY